MYCRSKCTFFAVLATLVVSVSIVRAEPPPRDHWDHDREQHRGYVLDERYHHNRYYPPRGFVTRVLPVGYVTIRHPTGEYYFHEGVWYRRRGPGFIVIAPPVGLTIAALPIGFTTVWVRGVPYFYAGDVSRAATGRLRRRRASERV